VTHHPDEYDVIDITEDDYVTDDADEADEEPQFVANETIEKMIRSRQPDFVEDYDDLEWLDEIVTEVGDKLAPVEAKHIAAAALVRRVYERMTRRANRLIRKWHESGQWPLDPMDAAELPLALNGKGKKVRLGAMRANDFHEWMAYQSEGASQRADMHAELMKAGAEIVAGIGGGTFDEWVKKP
jgi:hypothetical protein